MATTNPLPIQGLSYTFDASGGFSMQQTLPEILLLTEMYVQDALQIRMSVETFNKKISITKDRNNQQVLEGIYNTENDSFIADTVSINADEIVNVITTNNIISMGSLSTLYSDFNYTVLEYFGVPDGSSKVFSGEQNYNLNNGVFDASALIHILSGKTFNFTGSYVSDLSGVASVSNLTEYIKNACFRNPFSNRPPELYHTYKDGFIAGDLIYIKEGISITLSVDVEAEPYIPKINTGPTNLLNVNDLINYENNITNVKKQTTSSLVNITQVYTVPILIVLSNLVDLNYIQYGTEWKLASNDLIKNWLSCTLSANGQYQTAIEEFGGIYISSDFGLTWTNSYNIGTAMSNSISMSYNGRYQTASNGTHIFVSSDYGVTWDVKYNFGNSQIFVCISLNGKYQKVISMGDGIYSSSNYGISWTKYNQVDSDIYNSILSFPSAGVCMSYDGRYQSIASEQIYLSNDYGVTWDAAVTNINLTGDDRWFDDHNWYGIDMSSDGQMQVAIEIHGGIYISIDYGKIWKIVDLPIVTNLEWQAVSMSATGKYITTVAKNGSIYYSTDYGLSWERNTADILENREWICVAVSSNAYYQLAGIYGGGLYSSKIN